MHSDSVPERIFEKLNLKKVSRRQQKRAKLPRMQRLNLALLSRKVNYDDKPF